MYKNISKHRFTVLCLVFCALKAGEAILHQTCRTWLPCDTSSESQIESCMILKQHPYKLIEK